MGQIWALCTSSARHDVYTVNDNNTQTVEQPNKVYSWDNRMAHDANNYILDGLEDDTAVRLHGQIAGQQFVIRNCKNSIIALLEHTAAVSVDDCFDCTLLIGPCRGSVFVRDCSNVTVLAACQQFRATDCDRLDAWLHCATVPTMESSKGVRLACLQLHYDQMGEHMRSAALSPFNSRWSAVHDFTPAKGNWSIIEQHSSIADLQKLYTAMGKDLWKSNMALSQEQSDVPWTAGKGADSSKHCVAAFVLCFGSSSQQTDAASSGSAKASTSQTKQESKNVKESLVELRRCCMQLSKAAQGIRVQCDSEAEGAFESIQLEEGAGGAGGGAMLMHTAELQMDTARLGRIVGGEAESRFKDRLKHGPAIGMEWRLQSEADGALLHKAALAAFALPCDEHAQVDEPFILAYGESANSYLTKFWHEASVQFSA